MSTSSSTKFLGIALTSAGLILGASQAQAMMLTGGVEESSLLNISPVQTSTPTQRCLPERKQPVAHHKPNQSSNQPSAPLSSQVPSLGRMTSPSNSPSNFSGCSVPSLQANPASMAQSVPTTPATVQGVWVCRTQVIESSAPTVTPGTVVECQIKFKALDANRVVAQWAQKGWAPSSAAVGRCGGNMLRIVHESSNNGMSAARSDDYVQVMNPQVMRSISIVNQFENGAYVGSYKTQSVLQRI